MPISAVTAVLAGASFAVAGVLQQRAASRRPSDESLSLRLIADLAHRRLWLTGIGFAVLSYGFQSIALLFGPLALVQPLVVSEIVFAVPVSVRLHQMRLRRQEWAGVAAVAVGLATALLAASPQAGQPRPSTWAWLTVIAAAGPLSAAAVLVGRRCAHGPWRASLYAAAAAVVMAVQSALLDTTVHSIADGGFTSVFTSWQTYGVVVASVGGLVLMQSAFQAGPLAASMPVVDAVEPLTAVAIGLLLFDESVSTTPLRLGITAVGVMALVTGILLLDSSPVVQRLQRAEAADRCDRAADVRSAAAVGPAPWAQRHGLCCPAPLRRLCSPLPAAASTPPEHHITVDERSHQPQTVRSRD